MDTQLLQRIAEVKINPVMLQSRPYRRYRALATAIVMAAASCAVGIFAPCRAQSLAESLVDTSLVHVRLVTDVHAVTPGTPFWVAVRFDIADDWHINWRNPGDAGLAPAIDWQLPAGFKADPVRWPYPERYAYGPLVIFGYGDGVELVTQLTPPQALDPYTPVTIEAQVTWLACQEVCVPGESVARLELPTAAAAPEEPCKDCPTVDRGKLPLETGTWRVDAWYRDDYQFYIDLGAPGVDAPQVDDVFFFPYESGIIENGERQTLSGRSGGYRLTVERSRMAPITPERIQGVIVAGSGWGDGFGRALEVDVPLVKR